MSKLIINFEAQPDLSVPWPVGVENGTVTSGLGNDDGARLVGFGKQGEYHIDVFPEAVINDPSLAVGLVPTFANGTLFEWGVKVSSVDVIDASDVVPS